MDRDERRRLRGLRDEINVWVHRAEVILVERSRILADRDSALASLLSRVVRIRKGDQVAWRILPLVDQDQQLLAQLARAAALPPLSQDDVDNLEFLRDSVAPALHASRSALDARRFFAARDKRDLGSQSAEFLSQYHGWATSSSLPAMLTKEYESIAAPPPAVHLSESLHDRVGLKSSLAPAGLDAELLPPSDYMALMTSVAEIGNALQHEARYRDAARSAADTVQHVEATKVAAGMSVERLKETTQGRLRLTPLTDVGIRSVLDVLQQQDHLEALPGIGRVTAGHIRGAARSLWQMTIDDTIPRLNASDRNPHATELLNRLAAWDSVRQVGRRVSDIELTTQLGVPALSPRSGVVSVVVLAAHHSVADFRTASAALPRLPVRSGAPTTPTASPWDDFLARPSDYFAMLSELGYSTADEAKSHGDLPQDIIQAVRACELDSQHLTASLRGYQSFAARFALVQRKVVIGDEMGLGKTVEALAVLAHLYSKGSRHSVVVCPAAVVTNWIREIHGKSTVPAHLAHGADRMDAIREWLRDGGIAVTTFETLAVLSPQIKKVAELGCIVVDEAHYIKNPTAQRSQRTRDLIHRAERAVLLTGTPIENRLEEFRALVNYLRPDLTVQTEGISARRFRQQVAPAYLRRNQEGVLDELPEKIETDDWIPMSPADAVAYRNAVADGNFAAMRQAAMISGAESAKMQRLVEIVGEAEDNGRRVIVFSQFRATLDAVCAALPGVVIGPLTGSVPAQHRQRMVDEFSAARHGAVLVSQIVAGGVGLNVQAASVVVICEPQFKPSAEWQAIARAHRMGQLDVVQVHRLLTEDGVDRRVREILARKAGLFNEFARISETAGSAPEAYDISEADIARQIVDEERRRILGE